MRKRIWPMFTALALTAHVTSAQRGARISGIVRDSAMAPVPNVDVLALPSEKRVRTDSAGRFEITGLESGKYTVRARRFGYALTEWSVDLSNGGHADVQLMLGAKLISLDPVVVSADRTCSATKFEGFMCRRASAKGVFLDYTDIDDKDAAHTGDLFDGVEGFRPASRPIRGGFVSMPIGQRCIISLVNGLPTSIMEIPQDPYDLMAVEVYRQPEDIPKEFRRFTWGKERCSLVAFWTVEFSTSLPHLRLPR